jgi:inorganic pyrophosphatase
MRLFIVVEWPKGSRVRWEWDGRRFARRLEDAPAPVNYGFVPNSHNPADQSEVDAVLLGLPVPAGKRVEAGLVGVVELADGDHKLILHARGEPPREDEAKALLAWFPAERRPRLLFGDAARALARAMLGVGGR